MPGDAQLFGLFEGAGDGIGFGNMWTVVNGHTFGSALVMLFLDFFLYTFLGFYLDLVLPKEFGTRQTPCFCFKSCCPDKQPTAAGNGEVVMPVSVIEATYELPEVEDPRSAHTVSLERGQKCVHISGLTKRFKTPDGVKTAVDNLSLSMHEGSIFGLLGHNGAGKTTLISVLTGLYSPTEGDATLYGKSVKTHMNECRAIMGNCFQHDVLYPDLTVTEHLRCGERDPTLFFLALQPPCWIRLMPLRAVLPQKALRRAEGHLVRHDPEHHRHHHRAGRSDREGQRTDLVAVGRDEAEAEPLHGADRRERRVAMCLSRRADLRFVYYRRTSDFRLRFPSPISVHDGPLGWFAT